MESVSLSVYQSAASGRDWPGTREETQSRSSSPSLSLSPSRDSPEVILLTETEISRVPVRPFGYCLHRRATSLPLERSCINHTEQPLSDGNGTMQRMKHMHEGKEGRGGERNGGLRRERISCSIMSGKAHSKHCQRKQALDLFQPPSFSSSRFIVWQ